MHTCRSRKYNALCFNHDLSPLQIRNLEEILQTPVMDRTELILAIFESRAVTRTARLQIECAQLKKLLPRLIGANTQLGRQSGSGKNRVPEKSSWSWIEEESMHGFRSCKES